MHTVFRDVQTGGGGGHVHPVKCTRSSYGTMLIITLLGCVGEMDVFPNTFYCSDGSHGYSDEVSDTGN